MCKGKAGSLGSGSGSGVEVESKAASSSSSSGGDDLGQQAFDVVCNAFAQILGIEDRASITAETDFFAEGGGSSQVRALQDYLEGDILDGRLRCKLEQHVLFTSPKVGDIVQLLLDKSEKVGKSDEELLAEATMFVKKAFSEVLSLEEDAVKDETDFFEVGGSSMQVRVLIDFIKADQGQHKMLQQSIEQHELFASPTVIAVAHILVQKSQEGGGGSTKPQKTFESVAEKLVLDNEKYYPASYAQEQTFVLNASGAGAAYNMPWIVYFQGKFNEDAMVQALDLVVKREQPLRTVLRLNPTPSSKRSEGTVQQRVLPLYQSRNCWELSIHEASTYEEAIDILEKEQDYIFDLTVTPISRLHIVNVNSTRHVVMCNSHHVHHDTGSVVNYRRHVMDAYIAICRNESVVIPNEEAPFDYVAYAVWQRQVLTPRSTAYQNQLAYWKSELDGARALTFPKDPTANVHGGPSGGMVTLRLEHDVAMKWKQCLSSHGCTPFMGGMTLLHILLSRWFNEKDIISGAAIANRDPHASYADRLGCFRNVLPIRSNRAGKTNPTYLEMLTQIKTKIIQSWSAKEIPYHLVIAGMGDKSFRGFNVMYAFQDAEWHTLEYDTSDLDMEAEVAYLTKDTTKFDVHLMLRWNADGGVDGDLIYSASKFGRKTMQSVADAFVIMATAVAEQGPSAIADQKILDLPMLSSTEMTIVREDWNKTDPTDPYPAPQSVAATLLTAMDAHDGVAVLETFSGASYTYSELRNNVFVVAAGIRSVLKKGRPRVALVFERGFEMYASLLGVLFVGGCIVPIDASNTPTERVVFMLNDSDADIIIFDKPNEEFVRQLGMENNQATIIHRSYDEIVEVGKSLSNADQAKVTAVEADSLAYILYTSGTTGQPKGVCISHANIHNSIFWWTNLVKLEAADKFLHFSSFSFVMCIRQIYPVFFVGATLVSPGPSYEFETAIVKGNVTKMAITPSSLATLDLEKCSSLKVVQVAGEACPEKLANDWAQKLDAFYIGLGPTELCGHACCGKFNVGDSVRIGFPVNNASAYILNEAGQIQPPGVIGELCIAGANVANGYLKRDDLTMAHFVNNPFDARKPRMYKVGDLARRHIDGKIEFIGRSDDQVKIRGFRIELKEIVSALVSSGLVAEAHVLPSEVKGVTSLIAYVKPKLLADEGDLLDKVKHYLEKHLPTYMIPSLIIPMERFPLNKNGKLDRGQLPKPAKVITIANEDVEVEAGINRDDPIVAMVLLVLANELKCSNDDVWKTVNQSFFEIGGTSLSAVQSLRQLSEALSIDLKVMDLIRQPSILDFIKHTLKEVRAGKSSTAATPLDLNVSFDGTVAKATGTELNWTLFRIVQAFSMFGIVALSLVAPIATAVVIFLKVLESVGFPLILPLLPSIYGCMAVTNLFITSLVLRLLPMAKTPSSYSLSSIHFVKWLVHKKMTQITVNMFWPANNTKVMTPVYKLLGAKIGSDVFIDSAIIDIPSLVTIRKNAAVGFCTRIVCGEMRGETLFTCPVELGQCVKTEPRSSITPGSYVPDGCVVRAWACVTSTLDTSLLDSAKELVGSPAILGKDIDAVSSHVPPVTQGYGYLLLQIVIMYIISMITFVGVGVSCVFGISLVKVRAGDLAQLLYFVVAGLPVAFVLLLLVIVFIKRTILNRPRADMQHTGVTFYLRVWTIDTLLLSPLLALALEYLLPPSMHHYFLRAMGGKAIGAHTFWNSPQLRAGCEHISIGEALHSGFLQIWDTQVVSAEGISFKDISIGNNCTIGQRTVVMPGCMLLEYVTCGSESILLKDMFVPPRGTVVGNPPEVFVSSMRDEDAVVQLQDSVRSSQSYERRRRRSSLIEFQSTNEDGSVHLFNCVAIVLNLIKLPFVVGVFVAYYYLFDYALLGSFGGEQVVLRVCVSALLTYLAGIVSIALFLSVATRSGLASFHSGSSGYYTSRFIVWWFFMWLNRLCSGLLLYPIHGTFLFNIWLRLTGAQIGERCFLDPGAAGWFELDGLQIEDGSFVMTPNVHGHFVDHGKLQFAPVTVGRKARVNDGATVMPFTEILGNVTLLTQCTTIKGNTLDSGIYMGNVAAVVKQEQQLEQHLEMGLKYLETNLAKQELDDEDDLRIVIVGQQAFGAAVLQKLLERGENIVAVCGNPTKPGEADDPLISTAKNNGIEVYQPKSWKSQAALEKMKSFEADFCLMAYVTKYFPPVVANTPKYGSACFHPSLLPLHRGPSAISWAIAMGRETTGVTIFEPTEGLDEGPIIIQKSCEIAPDDTLGDLYSKKLFPMGVDAMVECVDLVKTRQLSKREQDLSKGSYESWFRKDAVLVDFTRDVDSVYNIIRAANPSPGAEASYNGCTIKLYDSRKVADKGCEPGEVVDITDEGVLVQAQGGCILLKRVESPDGQRCHASKWASEAGLDVGSTFDPSHV